MQHVIIMRCIENCNWQNFDHKIFKKEYKALSSYFNASGKAFIVFTEGFWKHCGNPDIKAVSEEMGFGGTLVTPHKPNSYT